MDVEQLEVAIKNIKLDNVRIITADNKEISVAANIIPHMRTIQNIIYDLGHANDPIPVPFLYNDVAIALSFYEKNYHMIGDKNKPEKKANPKEINAEAKIHIIRILKTAEQNAEPFAIFNKERSNMLMQIANYLEATTLLHVIAASFAEQLTTVAAKMQSYTRESITVAVDQMREILGEPDDLTPEEKEVIWKRYSWCIEK